MLIDLEGLEELSLETLESIDACLYNIKSFATLRKEDKEHLSLYSSRLNQIHSKHNKKKNIVLWHIKKIVENSFEDYSDNVSERQRAYVNSLVKDILSAKDIYTTSLSKETLEMLDNYLGFDVTVLENVIRFIEKHYRKDLYKVDLDVLLKSKGSLNKNMHRLIEDIDIIKNDSSLIDSSLKEDMSYTISNIYRIYRDNNNIDISVNTGSPEQEILAEGHKGGGGVRTYCMILQSDNMSEIIQKQLPSIDITLLLYALKSLLRYKTSSVVLTESYGSLDTLSSKLAGLLIHIHYSGNNSIPIPREFFEQNGYERLTAIKLYDMASEDEISHKSLYCFQYLQLIEIAPPSEGHCKEYSLLPLGEGIVAGLALFYDRKYPIKELELQPGDLTCDYKDYKYYVLEKGFIPDIELIDKFLNKLKETSVNISEYVKDFKDTYPITKLSKESYRRLLITEYLDIQKGIKESVSILRNFDRDLNLLCSGIEISRLSSRDTFLSYENVWRLSYTGRLFQRHGLQGVSKKTKTIVHHNDYNYDIPSSQLRILVEKLEEVYELYHEEFTEEDKLAYEGISTLERYIEDKDFKYTILEDTGVDSTTWKKAIYSMVFGANINNFNRQTALGVILYYNSGNKRFNKDVFISYLEMFWKPIQLWFKYILRYYDDYTLDVYAESRLNYSLYMMSESSVNPKDYFYNGINFVDKRKYKFSNKAKLNSFILQGIESSFILRLMLLVPFHTTSYEFDGLVVDKDIPLPLIERARQDSTFRTGTVIVKPFE